MALGLTRDAIGHRVRTARLFPQHRGVYAVGRPDLTLEARLLAAVLALGAGAVLSHLAAAVLWGFLPARVIEGLPVDVLLNRQVRPRAGIRAHRTAHLATEDWTRCKGIRVTTAARTLLDLTAAVDADTLTRAINEALVQRRVSLPQLRALAKGSPGLRAVMKRGPSPTRSRLEDRLLAFLRHHGFPLPETNVRVKAGRRRFEVDALYRDQALVIEADGAEFHDTPLAQERDRGKQAALEAAGYRVLRVRWADTAPDNELTQQRIRAALTAPVKAATRRAAERPSPATPRAAGRGRAPSPA